MLYRIYYEFQFPWMVSIVHDARRAIDKKKSGRLFLHTKYTTSGTTGRRIRLTFMTQYRKMERVHISVGSNMQIDCGRNADEDY